MFPQTQYLTCKTFLHEVCKSPQDHQVHLLVVFMVATRVALAAEMIDLTLKDDTVSKSDMLIHYSKIFFHVT